MKVLGKNSQPDWDLQREKITPTSGFLSIFEPIKKVDVYIFETWEELTNILLDKDIVISQNGFKGEVTEMLILIKDNHILGYAARSQYAGNRVVIDSNYALIE